MIDKRKTVSISDIAIRNMYSIEAIVRILVEKGVCSQEELLKAVREAQAKGKK